MLCLVPPEASLPAQQEMLFDAERLIPDPSLAELLDTSTELCGRRGSAGAARGLAVAHSGGQGFLSLLPVLSKYY